MPSLTAENRPPLLLLPGALGAAVQLAPLANALAPQFRVRTLDFEGHGTRPGADRPFRLAHFAENVLAALAEMQPTSPEPVRVFGYSMGGYAALLAAHAQPATVHSVLTLGTKFVWDEAIAAAGAAFLDPVVTQAKVPAFAAALVARHPAQGWETVMRQTAGCLLDLGARPLLTPDVLGTIGCSVRVLVGDRDATVTVEESAAAARALPAGQLQVLPGVGHPLEKCPLAALVEVIGDFFRAK